MSIAEFIVSPLGIILTGLLSSIIGTGLYRIGERIYKKTNKKVKYKRFIKRLVSAGEMYCSGYTSAYAKAMSPFHQMLHVNKFTISLLMELLRIVIVGFAAVGLLIVFQEFYFARPIIVAVAGIIITVQYQKMKTLFNTYHVMFDHEFGEDYKKHMMDGMEKYWDELTGREKKQKD